MPACMSFFRHAGPRQGFFVGAAAEIGEGPFFAFCGLGNPDAFYRDLESWGLTVCGQLTFPDHYRYTDRDVAEIRQAAKQAGANAFVTTEKDAARLRGTDGKLALAITPFAVTLRFDDAALLRRLVTDQLFQARQPRLQT